MVNDVSRQLGAPVSLTDTRLNSIVFGPHDNQEIDDVRRNALLNRQTPQWVRDWFASYGTATADGPVRIPADPTRRLLSRVVVPTPWQGLVYGFLNILDEPHRLNLDQLGAVTEVAEEIGHILHQERLTWRREVAALRTLTQSDSAGEREQAAEFITSRGYVTERCPFTVVALARQTTDAADDALHLDDWSSGATESLPHSVLGYTAGASATLLVPLPGSADQAASLAADVLARFEEAFPGLRVIAGVAEPHTDVRDAPAALGQARKAAWVALAMPEVGPVAEWAKLGALRALTCIPAHELASIIDSRVSALLTAGDETIVATLEAYLDSGCNAHATASRLTIHRGTLYYRLHKAESLSGFDLRNGMDRLALHVGLKAHRLHRATESIHQLFKESD